jgi:hypothetical protein
MIDRRGKRSPNRPRPLSESRLMCEKCNQTPAPRPLRWLNLCLLAAGVICGLALLLPLVQPSAAQSDCRRAARAVGAYSRATAIDLTRPAPKPALIASTRALIAKLPVGCADQSAAAIAGVGAVCRPCAQLLRNVG